MISVTKEELSRRFEQYNKDYFNNSLGSCEFHFLNKNISILGKYAEKRNARGKISQIWLGRNIVWTDELLKNVLIHEMVHMYNFTIDKCKFDGVLGHGSNFRRQCKRLKQDYGIIIKPHSFGCKVEYIVPPKKANFLWGLLSFIIDR